MGCAGAKDDDAGDTRPALGPPHPHPHPRPRWKGHCTGVFGNAHVHACGQRQEGTFWFLEDRHPGWKAPPEQLGQAPGQGGQLSFLPAAIWPLSE